MSNSIFNSREFVIEKIKKDKFDLIIVGGGITGAGILLDATLRGLKCCLLEMDDFASGTSSRSTKLIHGGLRYLKQFNFKLVNETGKEREVVANISRHLTKPIRVMTPSYKGGNFSKFNLRPALWIYEKLAGIPKEYVHNSYSKKELLNKYNGLKENGLNGGVDFVEFATNDSRLTIELIKTAINSGGIAINRVKTEELIRNHKGQVTGIRAIDMLSKSNMLISTECVVNAAGPWSSALFERDILPNRFKIQPTKGVHIVFDKKRFNITTAIYFDTPDKRMIFAIPKKDRVYVGTTDTFYKGDLRNPTITKEDISYLIEACNALFPKMNLELTDIISGWAGVRPLIQEQGKAPSEISRKYEISNDKQGLVAIAGGKLTGYRTMAQKVTDIVIDNYFKDKLFFDCTTDTTLLTGGNFKSAENYTDAKNKFVEKAALSNWDEQDALWVFDLFGSESEKVLNMEVENLELPDHIKKSLMYCIKNEFVISPLDYMMRRTDLLNFYPEQAKKYYKAITNIINEQSNIDLDFIENEYKSIDNFFNLFGFNNTPE